MEKVILSGVLDLRHCQLITEEGVIEVTFERAAQQKLSEGWTEADLQVWFVQELGVEHDVIHAYDLTGRRAKE